MLFDHAIVNLTNREAKRNAIEAALQAAKEAGTLTYTDIMLHPQELVTFAFEVMDGVVLDSNNVPQYGQSDRIDLEPVRLIAIDPEYEITVSKWKTFRIPGTDQKARNREMVSARLGNDVTLDDRYEDERPPRRLLWEHGWPVRQFRSRTGEVGQIVEWKWLERAAQSADASGDFRSLYASLKARIEAPPKKIDKTAPPQGRQQENRP